MSIEIIAIVVFAAFFLLLATVLVALSRRSDPVEKRLEKIRTESDTGEMDAAQVRRQLEGLVAIDPESFHSLRADLAHAGFRGKNAVGWYWTWRIVLGLGFLAFGLWLQQYFENGALRVLVPLGVGLFGFAVPALIVNDRVKNRKENIRRAIPSVLDLIIVCVEAGLSLNAAIQRISKEMRGTYPELAMELNVLNQEIFLGFSRSEAFRNLALRTGVDELRSLATVLMQSDRLGTSIADVLRVQADILRTKRRQRAMEHAQKMPVKLLFPLIFFIFPELLVVLLGPAAIRFYRSLAGMQ
ncbi:MAG: type II secretion system F family protein [Candidatus Zixiibacteriota bacterium]